MNIFFEIYFKQIYKLIETSNSALQKISAEMVDSFPTKRFFWNQKTKKFSKLYADGYGTTASILKILKNYKMVNPCKKLWNVILVN